MSVTFKMSVSHLTLNRMLPDYLSNAIQNRLMICFIR